MKEYIAIFIYTLVGYVTGNAVMYVSYLEQQPPVSDYSLELHHDIVTITNNTDGKVIYERPFACTPSPIEEALLQDNL